MNTKSLHLIVGLLLLGCTSNHDSGKTKLVVGIVVDQMRMDYLYRFQSHFSEHGFKRFYDEGFVAKNHHFDYYQTKTGPGHASIATGTPPAIYGIQKGSTFQRTKISDIAPTICALLEVSNPTGVIGNPVGEALESR